MRALSRLPLAFVAVAAGAQATPLVRAGTHEVRRDGAGAAISVPATGGFQSHAARRTERFASTTGAREGSSNATLTLTRARKRW